MTIGWNNRNPSYHESKDDRVSFRVHNELMIKFRLAHPRVDTIDSKNAGTVDWQAFIPIQQVKQTMCSQN